MDGRGATAEATREFADTSGRPEASFRDVDGLRVSSIGLGTYLGNADDETDILYTEAMIEATRLGCNVVDTAANYRFQRSERSIGTALERLAASHGVARDQLVISTKGGFVPFDGARPSGPDAVRAYVERTFFVEGICTPADMTRNLQHCMAPAYLDHQIRQSCDNLGVRHLDVYYIHNPESQLPEFGRTEFERRVRAAFELMEERVADGIIGRYGVATWNAFRVDPDAADYLSLERLVAIARTVGGDDHHFRVVQLPYNLALPEAFASYNQQIGDSWTSTLDAATKLGIAVFGSASLMQARLSGPLPDEVTNAFELPSNAQRALQFARSTPGVTCALAGMARTAHVRENVELLGEPPAPSDAVRALFEDV